MVNLNGSTDEQPKTNVTIEGAKAIFKFAEAKITLKKGESKTFTIRSSEMLNVTKNLEFTLTRAETKVGKVPFTVGNEASIDYRDVSDDKDTISLGNVVVEKSN